MTTLRINRDYCLSTEHPASSYGQPVLVDEAGQAYGPADYIAAPLPQFFAPGVWDGQTAASLVEEEILNHSRDLGGARKKWTQEEREFALRFSNERRG